MQKWFDDGYFTADLLMKRTHIDTEWIAVGVLERRAGGGKIFLSQLPISTGPPGLVIPTESPQSYSPVHEQSTFNGYQPVPTRTLRTATLDSYLRGASPSESPSSSLSGGRFGNGSPDPSAFGGRAGSSDPSFGGRGFGGRTPFQEDSRSFNSAAPGRAPSIDTFNNHSGSGSPWSAGPGQMNQGFNGNEHHHFSNGFNGVGSGMIGTSIPMNQVHGFNQEHFRDTTYSGMGSLTNQHGSPISRQPSDANGTSNMMNNLGSSQFGALSQAHFSPSPSVPYPPSQQRQSVSPLREVLPQTSESPNLAQTPASAVQPNSALPWGTRTRPFDEPAATSPVVAPARPQPPQPVDPSPWLTASLPAVDDVWREMPGPNSLTFSNLGQHNRLQQEEEEAGLTVSPIEEDPPLLPAVQQTPTEPTPAVSTTTTVTALQLVTSVPTMTTTTEIPAPAAPKARRKSTARDVQAAVTKVTPPPPPPAVIKSPSPVPVAVVVPPKPAWATEEDTKKQKGTGTTMSLREIQEAETKKTEARKVTEKERERLARAATSPPIAEETQPFTASWGLPTSQTGARNVMSPKEASSTSPTSATTNAPVWTNAAPTPAAKKTMKEIQEEEERRKKLAVKESMASAAARRAYAETTVKVLQWHCSRNFFTHPFLIGCT
jgi:PERQ amino acid-rich with GYF domain-containing protein